MLVTCKYSIEKRDHLPSFKIYVYSNVIKKHAIDRPIKQEVKKRVSSSKTKDDEQDKSKFTSGWKQCQGSVTRLI